MSNSNGEMELDPICDYFRTGDTIVKTESLFGRYMMTFGGLLCGITSIALSNLARRRPGHASIYKYFIAGSIGLVAGEYMNKYKNKMAAEKDLQYYHYMMLHPEDFPPPKRILFRDYLEPWCPVR